VELGGRPLLSYPLAALAGAGLGRLAVVCKRATEVPLLPEGIERWEEPDEPSHPALGIAQALESAGGSVLVVATDMPWVGAGECRLLLGVAAAAEPPPAAVVAVSGGRLAPVLGVYRPAALPALRAAARDGAPLTRAVEALRPVACELPAAVLRGVNAPDELAAAERALIGAAAARSRRR
jgi:molybdopterin-guanine dinucleotide biosynthesis protein A